MVIGVVRKAKIRVAIRVVIKGSFGRLFMWLKTGSFGWSLMWLKRGSFGWLLG